MKNHIIITSGLLLLCLTGCSTPKISPYVPDSTSITERTAQESGVEVAVDPFVESSRTEKYFDLDAIGNGIAILHVRIINKTADQTFLALKDNIRLFPDGVAAGLTEVGMNTNRSKIGDNLAVAGAGAAVGATVGVSAATAAVAISPAGLLLGSSLLLAGMASDSKHNEIQRNFMDKEIGDATLSPGKSIAGFVYYGPLKKGEDWTHKAVVNLNMIDTKTRKQIEINIPLSH